MSLFAVGLRLADDAPVPRAELQRLLDRVGDAADVGSRLRASPGSGTTRRSTTTSIVCFLYLVELDLVAEVADLAVDAHADEAGLAHVLEDAGYSPLRSCDQRRQDHDPRALGQSRTASTICSTVCCSIGRPHFGQCGRPDARVEQAQVVVDLGDGADGRARVVAGALLVDRDGGREARRCSRRRACPSGRGTAGRRRRATRRSGAGPRRRSCRRRARTCRSRTGR